MKIIITGASGNIGSKLFAKLIDGNGNQVIGLSRSLHKGLETTDYSISELEKLFQNADIVVHLASHRGTEDDYHSFIDNETITENILKAMQTAKVPRIIFMSSIAVYSDESMLPWKEEQYPTPQSFYGLSKLTCEYLCKQYSAAGIDYTIFRCGIVFGGDHSKRMVSTFIDEAIDKKTLSLNGKSIARRDFIYVKDTVSALLWGIYEAKEKNQIYNLGCGVPMSNLEIAETINECFDNTGNLIYDDSVKETVINSYMDISKISGAGFHNNFTFNSALQDIKQEYKQQ